MRCRCGGYGDGGQKGGDRHDGGHDDDGHDDGDRHDSSQEGRFHGDRKNAHGGDEGHGDGGGKRGMPRGYGGCDGSCDTGSRIRFRHRRTTRESDGKTCLTYSLVKTVVIFFVMVLF